MNTLYDKLNYGGKEPLEDTFQAATPKQINYLEILRVDLGYSLAVRNAKILDILHKPQVIGVLFDVYCLSKQEAGVVIGQFKAWKEERKNG
jgi:hypothetical protein